MRNYAKTALIIVDMQRDFTDGPLGSKEAEAAIPVVESIIKAFIAGGGRPYQLIWTKDTHQSNYLNTLEGKKLPITHCFKNETGWEITPKLRKYAKNAIVIEKNTFGCMSLPQYIDHDIEEIVIVGVCTDICVISNAIILRAMFPNMKITVYENACAGVTPEKNEAALETMRSCQIDVKTYTESEE